jgi:hypothetical protein
VSYVTAAFSTFRLSLPFSSQNLLWISESVSGLPDSSSMYLDPLPFPDSGVHFSLLGSGQDRISSHGLHSFLDGLLSLNTHALPNVSLFLDCINFTRRSTRARFWGPKAGNWASCTSSEFKSHRASNPSCKGIRCLILRPSFLIFCPSQFWCLFLPIYYPTPSSFARSINLFLRTSKRFTGFSLIKPLLEPRG